MTFELTPDEDRTPEELARLAKLKAKREKEDARFGCMAVSILGVILLAVLFGVGSCVFNKAGPSGDGSLHGWMVAIVGIAFFAGLIGTFIKLPFFGNLRRVGLAVLLLSLAGGVPLANAVRTPQQVAEDARLDQILASAEAGEKAKREISSSEAGYSDTAVKAAAIQAVKRRLLDERSARFRNVVVVPSEIGTKAVCGEVNSKNRAGGYAGYQRFISAGVDKYTWLEEDMPDFRSAWNEVCVR